MFHIIFTIHIVLCLGLVFLVLIQHGKGADMGAAFGGGSNTVFGASGAPDFLTKVTTGIAIAFMITSVILVKTYSSLSKQSGPTNPLAGSVMEGLEKPAPAAEKVKEAAPVEAPEAASKESAVSEPAKGEEAAPAADAAKSEPKEAAAAAPAEPAAPVAENAADQAASDQVAPPPADSASKASNDSQTASEAPAAEQAAPKADSAPAEEAPPAGEHEKKSE